MCLKVKKVQAEAEIMFGAAGVGTDEGRTFSLDEAGILVLGALRKKMTETLLLESQLNVGMQHHAASAWFPVPHFERCSGNGKIEAALKTRLVLVAMKS